MVDRKIEYINLQNKLGGLKYELFLLENRINDTLDKLEEIEYRIQKE